MVLANLSANLFGTFRRHPAETSILGDDIIYAGVLRDTFYQHGAVVGNPDTHISRIAKQTDLRDP